MRHKRRKMGYSTGTAKKHVPPQIPKCVRKCEEGYCTNFFTAEHIHSQIALSFQKSINGYIIYYRKSDGSDWKNISSDVSLSPATRARFENQTTLTGAIKTVEEWLKCTLPEIR